jgi:hypothetical protein
VASGEYKNISFIHEIADSAVNDVMAETALPDIPMAGAELQTNSLDHARDHAKHEAV